MLNLALFGPPGAGKGTQSKLLIEKYNLVYISTGDILRQEISEKTDLGLQAKAIIDKGRLVSEDLIVQIIEKRISMNPHAKGILFDGFPRTVVQAYILEGLLLRLNTSLDCMISLEVPNEELLKRMLERAKTSGRSDDNEEVIRYRLQEYENKTLPVSEFYHEREKFYPINGVGTIDDIFDRICAVIDKTQQNELFNIVLSGPPGAGKGTQGQNLAREFNLTYLSSGHLLREQVKEDTDLGRRAKEFIDKGDNVPDEIVVQVIDRALKMHKNSRGFIFKGFPRTIVQAYILDGLLRKFDSSVTYAIDIRIPHLESVKRLLARAKTPRKRIYDENPEIIIHRLEEYELKSEAVCDYYKKQNAYIAVDGMGSSEDVSARLLDTIHELVD